jgi:hypothetical protein
MVRLLSMICFVMLTLLIVLAVLLIIAPEALIPTDQGPFDDLPSGVLRVFAIAVAVALLLPPIWGVLSLMRLSRAYLQNQVFTPAPARHLMSTGSALIATAVLKIASVPIFGVLVWLAKVEGGERGEISLAFGSAELALIGGGLLLRTIGRVLLDAVRIAEENQEFI